MAGTVAVEERRIFMYIKNKSKIKTKYLVMAAFLTALSIVLTRFFSVMLPEVRIGIGKVPIVMSGLLFGPMLGGISGAAADLVGMLLFPTGAYHPGFTISSMLDGLIPGIFALYFNRHLKKGVRFNFSRILVVQIVLTILNSIILNTLWLTQYLGKGFIVLLPARVLNAVISLPIQTIIIYYLIKYLGRMLDD